MNIMTDLTLENFNPLSKHVKYAQKSNDRASDFCASSQVAYDTDKQASVMENGQLKDCLAI